MQGQIGNAPQSAFLMAEYDLNYAQINNFVQKYYSEIDEKKRAMLLATLVSEYDSQDIQSANKFTALQSFWEEQIGNNNCATLDLGPQGQYFFPVHGMVLNFLKTAIPLVEAAIEYFTTQKVTPSVSMVTPGIAFAEWLMSVKKLTGEEYCLFLQIASKYSKSHMWFSFDEIELVFPSGEQHICDYVQIENCTLRRHIDQTTMCDMLYVKNKKALDRSNDNLKFLLIHLERKGLIHKVDDKYYFLR